MLGQPEMNPAKLAPRLMVCRIGLWVVVLLLLFGCSIGPGSVFGTYALRACRFIDSIPHPIPCAFEQPSAGDTLRFESGRFALRADSTWERTTIQTQFLNGTWGTTVSDTLRGTFSVLAPQGGYQIFQLHIPGVPDDPVRAAIVARDTLIAGVFVYTR